MGQQLAQMHRSLSPQGHYGLDKDNFIGTTPQHNDWMESWCDFFIQRRLTPQIELFEKNDHSFDQKELLLNKVQQLLEKHHPPPSLLHGYFPFNLYTVVTFGEEMLRSSMHPFPLSLILLCTMETVKQILL